MMHAHHQPLATNEDVDTVELSDLHGGNVVSSGGAHHHHHLGAIEPHRSWLLDSESEYETDDEENHHRLGGGGGRRQSSDGSVGTGAPRRSRRTPKSKTESILHMTKCKYCKRLFFCCKQSTCQFILMMFIFVFTFATFGMAYRSDSCWTAKDELLLMNRFDQNSANGKAGPWPLKVAHSHNDYQQTAPLREALLAGFCSLEGDVFILTDGVLYLGHMVSVEKTATLEEVYLKPMIDLVKQNGGMLYKRSLKLGVCQQVTLLVDLKSVETRFETWIALEALLAKVDEKLADGRPIFETFDSANRVIRPDGVILPSPIRIVVTGLKGFVDQVAQAMSSRPERKTSIDLDVETYSAQTVSRAKWISEKWHFPWPDANPTSLEKTRKAIQSRVQFARDNGLMVRYWDTSDKDPDMWEFLLENGVDLINTDTIFTLHSFLVGTSVARGD